jgi:uncharacterized protein YndB with AHSA1/START domain
MIPTGTLDTEARTLVLTRSFAAPIDDVWASVTESDRLARWFGTWTGDPADGWVMVSMNAEPEEGSPTRFAIEACEPPRLLRVSATDVFGHWVLVVELAEEGSGTLLTFRHEELDPASAHEVGPGWEWYLDRLVAAVSGEEPPGLAAFETDYMTMGDGYAAMAAPPAPPAP